MTTSPNLLSRSESSARAAVVQISPLGRFVWLVRREIWENRSIYLAPAAVGAVALLGFLVAMVQLPGKIRAGSTVGGTPLDAVVEAPFVAIALILMLVDLIVAAFYCLDALYGERRDRSVLFWKSLPVSDLETVLAKATIPILVLPFVTCVVTVGTQVIMLLVGSIVLAANGMNAAILWAHVPILQTAAINFYHLIVFHGFWYAPFYGWLLLASAWAKRTPFLWAVLPAVAIGVVEEIGFNSSQFAMLLLTRFAGEPASANKATGMTMAILVPHHAGHFLISLGMWIGLGITAVFLVAAAHLRRSRGVS